jgi:diamine N-acetyltransferase
MHLESDLIRLRALEKQDATKLMIWENNPKYWRVSDTEAPFSLHAIQQFIEQHETFRQAGQVRLMIVKKDDNEPIGCIDLYDGNQKHRRAALGILIAEEANRGRGFATESVRLMLDYAREILDLHQIYVHIEADNTTSIQLFENAGFEHVGSLKDWRRWNKTWHDTLIYQKILDEL